MHVDIAIIGGGAAGLATALALRRRGLDAVVFEQAPAYELAAGKGFLLMPNGTAALSRLGLAEETRAQGCCALHAVHRTVAGEVVRDVEIPEHLGILRSSLLEVLLRALPPAAVRTGMQFAGFEGTDGCRRASFSNGERVTARVFVGADGIDSPIRQETFGEPRRSPTPVRELVAVIPEPQLATRYAGRLVKVEDRPRRRVLGLFAVGDDDLLWYLRWDSRDQDLTDHAPAERRAFVDAMTAGWPRPAASLVESTDFSECVVLNSVQVELPPSFTYDNVVLVGDAAHALIRLTTQGVNTALEDAVLLAKLLAQANGDVEPALEEFSAIRHQALRAVLEDGHRKVDAFLNPPEDPAA